MKAFAIAIFLLLLMHWTVSVKGAGETLGNLGESTLLPCYSLGNNTPASYTQWSKDGQLLLTRNHTKVLNQAAQRLSILDNGSLEIRSTSLSDQGMYVCDSQSGGNHTQSSVALHVVSGPLNVTAVVRPVSLQLPNGTQVVYRGSNVSMNCSSQSFPAQNLSWSFHGASLVQGSGAWLDLKLDDIQPSAQGEYTCTAQNTLSQKAVSWSTLLLVYYAPERHPECQWSLEEVPSQVLFNCSWFGAYPTPTLLWGDSQDEGGGVVEGDLLVSQEADSLVLRRNRSQLHEGLKLKCNAHHRTLPARGEKACSFTLRSPYPKGDPLAVGVKGTNVTLTCSEDSSLPPARTTWKRTAEQLDVVPGPKYQVTQQGPVFSLTIVNLTQQDEGLYFCRSENPLMVREMEVYLTVKTTSVSTGVVMGTFLAILIVGLGVVVAKSMYSSRDRICLAHGFGRMEEERGDVLSLVESDEEEIFQDTVPRLPPLENGQNTTLVEIHRIPSSDHDDTETVGDYDDQDSGRQSNTNIQEDNVDLVTF
ncbi:V-set and immunoglobulin domain-containing protein 10 isoform X1 [Osmerus eperlanus]|uniref:V-set and immunoglobulin domain-containing protein 10 isoform X1 n=2 Tax=Osmerus eperlanus TaxID=29151 RepID=UPI002E15E683